MTVHQRTTDITIGRVRVNNPESAKKLSQKQKEWKAETLRRLGWQGKTNKQNETFNDMDIRTREVLENNLKNISQYRAKVEYLAGKSGKTFKRYQEMLSAFEELPTEERTPQKVEELKRAAQAYISHFEDEYSSSDKKDKNNLAKKSVCEDTVMELRKFEIARQFRDLASPPWDNVKSMKVASLKTALDISSLPKDKQRVEQLDGDTANPGFWINRDTGDKKQKTFIFKPSTSMGPDPRFPDNGEPSREALAGRVAEILNGDLGFRLPMPETQVISIGRESFPKEALDALKDRIGDKDSYVGSVQQFEQTAGSMHSLDRPGRGLVSTQSTQEMAIFDTITLNTDRHAGNFLVRNEGNEKQLVPIDHGLCFPPRSGADRITERMGDVSSNALMRLPGSHEKFTPESLESIRRLDPGAMAEALKQERETLEGAHPETSGTLSDDAIELSRRSAMFLKLAAPRLTPAAVQIGLSRFHAELFDPELDVDGFNALAGRIIDELETEQEALKEYCMMPREMRDTMDNDLLKAGWKGSHHTSDSVLRNMTVALKIWKMETKQSELRHDLDQRPIDMSKYTDEDLNKELERINRIFPATTMPTDGNGQRAVMEAWVEWQRLGSDEDNLKRLEGAMRLLGVSRKAQKNITDDLVKAVDYLQRGGALKDALENDQTDAMLFDIRKMIEYVEKLLPALPPGERHTTEQTLATTKARLEGNPDDNEKRQLYEDMKNTQDEAMESGRVRLLPRFDTLINRELDEEKKKWIKKQRGFVESYDIFSGYLELKNLDPQLADED
jgi:hypothetical protein